MKDMLKYSIAFITVTFGFYYASLIIFDNYSAQSQTLTKLWREDMARLEQDKILPVAMSNLREVEWVTPDKNSKLWAQFSRLPFQVKQNGEYKLELLVVSQNDNGHLSAMIQHHLIHIASGNSVWELGRTYVLPHHE